MFESMIVPKAEKKRNVHLSRLASRFMPSKAKPASVDVLLQVNLSF
jgi:hypothetical protein